MSNPGDWTALSMAAKATLVGISVRTLADYKSAGCPTNASLAAVQAWRGSNVRPRYGGPTPPPARKEADAEASRWAGPVAGEASIRESLDRLVAELPRLDSATRVRVTGDARDWCLDVAGVLLRRAAALHPVNAK